MDSFVSSMSLHAQVDYLSDRETEGPRQGGGRERGGGERERAWQKLMHKQNEFTRACIKELHKGGFVTPCELAHARRRQAGRQAQTNSKNRQRGRPHMNRKKKATPDSQFPQWGLVVYLSVSEQTRTRKAICSAICAR